MKQFLMITCGILFVTSVAIADDTSTEMCANGAGFVVEGAVTGHKYCVGRDGMDWHNAYSWCDALGKQLFDLSDCACSETQADCAGGGCPEMALYAALSKQDIFNDTVPAKALWTKNLRDIGTAYRINSAGKIDMAVHRGHPYAPICK